MRLSIRSQTYLERLDCVLADGAGKFGARIAKETLRRIDRTIERYLAYFPGSKMPDPDLGLVVYPVTKTPFVVIYDYDDLELRVHFIEYASADLTQIDPTSAEW